jgi:2-keto-4-pentenoate hydratase/2-oxohepta-3-ene-1,7-dioic acid hydratase in catechol pathway
MKLAYFDNYRVGVLREDGLVDITPLLSELPHRDARDLIIGLIENIGTFEAAIEDRVQSGSAIPLSQVRLRAPVPAPRNMVCMAVNYDDGLITSPFTNAFHKAASTIIGNGDAMILPDIPASVFEGEAELAIVIGHEARNVSPHEAMEYVFGYTNFIDGSARGVQPATNSFFQMKSRATFSSMGPYLVTKDEIDDPQNLQVRLWVNGQLKQDFNTAKMVTNIKNSVAWASSIHPLLPGDIIPTGTDHCGLSAFQDGDIVDLETQGLGRLQINVQDPLKRTWSRETRIERHRQGFQGLDTIAPQLTGKYAKGELDG